MAPETGLARARARSEEEGLGTTWTRFEAEEVAFHQRLRDTFLELAGQEPDRYEVLDAEQDPASILAAALELVLPLAPGTA